MPKFCLHGSERTPLPNAEVLCPADPAERLEVTVVLRRAAADAFHTRVAAVLQGQGASSYLSREQYAQLHGASDADLNAVSDFAAVQGLTVVQASAARRSVILAGTVAQFEAAFTVQLNQMRHASCTYRGRSGSIELPEALDGIVQAVLGLDSRPQALTHFRVRPASSTAVSYTPTQLAALYGFPSGSGAGECIALIELGGGYRPADLDTYFAALGVSSPTVLAVSVDQAQNTPTGDASGPDGEVMLDIEVVGGIAPQAKIAVYFAPNTDAGFLNAITTAIHDTANKPSIISISWGGPESSWTAQAMTAMDDAFQSAATLGITVCVASGDNGSSDGAGAGNQVDFPASSPFALACGGTSLRVSGNRIGSEVVWNDGSSGGASGGGISTFFGLPTWQADLQATTSGGGTTPLSKRGVPDVAGDADPETGYQVRIDGTDTVIGGTSAVAPLWAALIARLNQNSGTVIGFANPTLYKNPRWLRDITVGNNGSFAAAAGWDACSGLGSPNGPAISGTT